MGGGHPSRHGKGLCTWFHAAGPLHRLGLPCLPVQLSLTCAALSSRHLPGVLSAQQCVHTFLHPLVPSRARVPWVSPGFADILLSGSGARPRSQVSGFLGQSRRLGGRVRQPRRRERVSTEMT